jgi:hypothetical protein
MRKTKEIAIPAGLGDGRDEGKRFLITEMPASRAEKWADRAFLALANSGLNLPAGIERSGMAGIAQIAHLVGGIKFVELEPLMDEIMGCIQRVEELVTRQLVENDIEEVASRQFLRGEVLDLHVNFSLAAVILNLIAAASTLTAIPISGTTPTSRRRSARLSRAA